MSFCPALHLAGAPVRKSSAGVHLLSRLYTFSTEPSQSGASGSVLQPLDKNSLLLSDRLARGFHVCCCCNFYPKVICLHLHSSPFPFPQDPKECVCVCVYVHVCQSCPSIFVRSSWVWGLWWGLRHHFIIVHSSHVKYRLNEHLSKDRGNIKGS